MSQARWDVFHAERLEAERGLTSLQVRQALARGELQDDDLIRPAGSSQPWVALADCPEIHGANGEDPAQTSDSSPSSVVALPPSLEADPKTQGVSSAGLGALKDTETEMFNLSEEFAAPAEDKVDEVDDADQTRFFHGINDDEFDLLGEADRSVAFPRGTSFGFGPSEDQLNAISQEFPRPDGKVEDPLNFDPNFELDANRLGTPIDDAADELITWDDGEPSSLVKPAPKPVDDSAEFLDEDSSKFLEDAPELLEDDDEFAAARQVSAKPDSSPVDSNEPDQEEEPEEYEEEDDVEPDPVEEEEAAAEFTLARGSADTVEELDLAAMVDVAFQLVLFFLVTATTVLYKSLEVPKPNPETSPAASATQGKSLDELKNAFILVEIDSGGRLKIDQEAIDASHDLLVKRLRSAREETGRQSMLLSADFTTPHRSAVLAYDAANEIGLGIAIARPTPKP